jgi:hypothetical protein
MDAMTQGWSKGGTSFICNEEKGSESNENIGVEKILVIGVDDRTEDQRSLALLDPVC